MKKMFKLLIIALLVGACSNGKVESDSSIKCTYSEEGFEGEVTIDYNAKDNSIQREVSKTTLDLAAAGYEFADVEETLKEQEEDMKITGITFTYEHINGLLIQNIDINYSEADFKELVAADIIEGVDTKTPTYIDYKLTIESYTEMGYSCK